MAFIPLITVIFQVALALWQYFRGNAEAKAAALAVLAKQFADLEAQGYTFLPDLLTAMNRSSWIDWKSIPTSKGENGNP